MRCKILTYLIVITISANFALADCPSADLTGDCFVDYEDFALMANQWLTTDPCIPEDMEYIPDGEFEMGDHHDGMSNALPVHAVFLDAFFMSTFEITNQQYCDYLNSAYDANEIKVDGDVVYASSDISNSYPYCDTSTSSSYSQINYSGGVFSVATKDGRDMSDDPMVMVSWYGAVAYCNQRSSEEGYESCYDLSTWDCNFSKHGYRLPTEAEWEYAGRGGEHNPYYRYPWGNNIDGSMANYRYSGDPYETELYPFTSPAGYYNGNQIPSGSDMANGYGLYDVAGNVWEWCNDWYGLTYYNTSPYDNPTGPSSGSYRVLRGGCWYGTTSSCRVAARDGLYTGFRSHSFGFRVVLDLN